jgi:hypothetical protein
VSKRIREEDSQAGTARRSRKNEAIRGLRIDDCQYQTVSFTPRTKFLNKRGRGQTPSVLPGVWNVLACLLSRWTKD